MSDTDDAKPPKSKRSVTPSPATQPSPPDQAGVSPVPQAVAQQAIKIMRKCKFGLGYKPDTHDKSKDQTIRHLLGALNGVTPPEVSNLEQYIYPYGVKDQGQSSECLAFAIARAATIRCRGTGGKSRWRRKSRSDRNEC